MNLLNYVSRHDLEVLAGNLGCGQYVNLHTKNKDKAIRDCIEFFASYDHKGDDWYFYTFSTDYNLYCGYEYKLSKGKNGTYWIILQNETPYEV